MGTRLAWLTLTILVAPCLGPGRSMAQEIGQAGPQFRAEVDLVQLQVGVVNVSGEFAAGLSAEEFTIVVEGDPRPAAVVYEVDLRTEALAGSDAAAATHGLTRPRAARRHFLFFFDFRYTTRRGVREARQAALDFLDANVRASDVLAVATINRFGIDIPIPFTTNVALARAEVEGISIRNATDAATEAGSFVELEAEVSRYVEALEWFAELLRAVGGRKHLVMFSTGFPDQVLGGASLGALSGAAEERASGSAFGYVNTNDAPGASVGSDEVRRGMQVTVERLIEADVVVHAVDPRGLRLEQDGHTALNYLASGTGGESYWNMNDLDVALDQIDAATNRFYMIAYAKKATDPSAVSIEVRVTRPGVRITSAPVRLAPPPAVEEMTDDQKWLRFGEIQP